MLRARTPQATYLDWKLTPAAGTSATSPLAPMSRYWNLQAV